MVELHGGFVLPNRLVVTDCQGHSDCRRLLLLEKAVVNVIADDDRQHIQSQRPNGAKHG